ncbi:MAG: DeoR/GlpR transcriptional regulator [Hyphomicrobiales bacterium]|nr:DeoR/GlpR transcriptional regulator [Hyphomicrobiales bacterium]
MKSGERQEAIVGLLRSTGKVSVEELAHRLEASKETIRRDLTYLSSIGLLRKIHGGALLPQVVGESKFDMRMSSGVAEKRAIAHVTAARFNEGDTLFVDTGSTTVYLAERLAEVAAMTVVTNSAMIAATMTAGAKPSRVFLLGGEFNAENRQTVGEFVIGQIRQFRAQHAILTVGAIDDAGVAMDYSLQEALVARVMIEQAQTVTIVADSSKFEKRTIFEVARPSDYHTIVSDQPPTDRLARMLEAHNVDFVVAAPDYNS